MPEFFFERFLLKLLLKTEEIKKGNNDYKINYKDKLLNLQGGDVIKMKIIYISGSPRKKSNTDYLLKKCSARLEGQLIKLSDYNISFCNSCWSCLDTEKCVINDALADSILPRVMEADAIVLGSPVYFDNISAQLKTFIDRTWSIKGKLRNKIGAAVVVGRKYGHQSAIDAINSFFVKHEIIPANRGICAMAFQKEKVECDLEAMDSVNKLCERIVELQRLTGENKNYCK